MSSQSPERYFPQKLQSMRERRRLSRQMLADLCGLSRNVIAQYERGKRFPSIRRCSAAWSVLYERREDVCFWQDRRT